jgi:3-isopropylmalate dehydrogenase
LAPSAEIGDRHALFQPSHGTAPTIAGKDIANPLAAILSGAMMLDWLGETRNDPAAIAAARRLEGAVAKVLASGRVRTPDMGGTAGTKAVGEAVVRVIEEDAA